MKWLILVRPIKEGSKGCLGWDIQKFWVIPVLQWLGQQLLEAGAGYCTQPFSSCWTQRILIGCAGHSGKCRIPILCQLVLFYKIKTRDKKVPVTCQWCNWILGEAWEVLSSCGSGRVGVFVHSCSLSLRLLMKWNPKVPAQSFRKQHQSSQQLLKGGNSYCLLSL